MLRRQIEWQAYKIVATRLIKNRMYSNKTFCDLMYINCNKHDVGGVYKTKIIVAGVQITAIFNWVS